jgi:signal peptidase I
MLRSNVDVSKSYGFDRAARRVLVGENPRRTLVRVVLLVAVAYAVFGHLLIPVRGQGPSMWPTLEDGQFVLVNRLAYWRAEPRRGDVVALQVAGGRVVYIKRIVGMPGERVSIERGTVRVNGVVLEEPYVRRRRPWDVGEVQLADDEYLVIGDNRAMPQRSHDFGKARRERVLGTVVRW